MDIVKDGMVIDPVIQNEIIARAVAGNFGDQPSQTIHSLGTVTQGFGIGRRPRKEAPTRTRNGSRSPESLPSLTQDKSKAIFGP
jgi:hypothetical protein